MAACLLPGGAATFKNGFCKPLPRFNIVGFKKGYWQKWNFV